MRMNDLPQSHEAAGWIAALFWKFAPGPLGALVMVIFDNPKTKKELFWRFVVAYIATVMFGETVFDFLHSLSWFAFLDPLKKAHTASVDFLVGGCGYSLLAGLSVVLRKFRTNPVAAAEDAKRIAP